MVLSVYFFNTRVDHRSIDDNADDNNYYGKTWSEFMTNSNAFEVDMVFHIL